MASKGKIRKKCFTFIWKLENARYCCEKNNECIQSPAFVVDEIKETTWSLVLFPRYLVKEDLVGIYLYRRIDDNESSVEISHDIAILADNGSVLHSISCSKRTFGKENQIGPFCCTKREDVFPARTWLHKRDTFTVRCKIWKSAGEISENVQCVARTRIGVEKRLFKWIIEDFRAVLSRKSYAIKSIKNNKRLMSLRLTLNNDDKIHFLFVPDDERIQYSAFQLSSVDASGKTIESLTDEIWFKGPDRMKGFASFVKRNVMEKKDVYASNNVLSLRCKLAISFGIVLEEIEGISAGCKGFEIDEKVNCSSGSAPSSPNTFPVSKKVLNESFRLLLDQQNEITELKSGLIDGFQSIVNNGSFHDLKLRTRTQTFPAHMFILSSRSPVFKALFLSEKFKQKNDNYVDIMDLDDDTITGILRYIYSSDVDTLDWSSAVKLYVGAIRYQIMDLKDSCSSFLKSNLSLSNACEALVLADDQRDENLKNFVRDFILKYAKCIMNSNEWEHLMKFNIKLAAETMHLKFKN